MEPYLDASTMFYYTVTAYVTLNGCVWTVIDFSNSNFAYAFVFGPAEIYKVNSKIDDPEERVCTVYAKL